MRRLPSSPPFAWTALLAVIAVGHHLGTLLSPLGDVGDAQWADWIDLALPWCVVATAGAGLLAVPARMQLLGAAGLVAYVQGHGIHLAANSIANQSGGDTAYLWDELVGHAIWYAGLYLVLAALLVGRAVREPPGPLRLLLAVAVGLTFATNALGGHSVGLAVLACSVLAALAWSRRSGNRGRRAGRSRSRTGGAPGLCDRARRLRLRSEVESDHGWKRLPPCASIAPCHPSPSCSTRSG